MLFAERRPKIPLCTLGEDGKVPGDQHVLQNLEIAVDRRALYAGITCDIACSEELSGGPKRKKLPLAVEIILLIGFMMPILPQIRPIFHRQWKIRVVFYGGDEIEDGVRLPRRDCRNS